MTFLFATWAAGRPAAERCGGDWAGHRRRLCSPNRARRPPRCRRAAAAVAAGLWSGDVRGGSGPGRRRCYSRAGTKGREGCVRGGAREAGDKHAPLSRLVAAYCGPARAHAALARATRKLQARLLGHFLRLVAFFAAAAASRPYLSRLIAAYGGCCGISLLAARALPTEERLCMRARLCGCACGSGAGGLSAEAPCRRGAPPCRRGVHVSRVAPARPSASLTAGPGR